MHQIQKKYSNIISIIWIALLSIFLLSSVMKAVNIHSFALETTMYIDAYMSDWLHPWARECAISVCVIEMLLALLSIRKKYRRLTGIGFFIMLSFFMYLTGVNQFYPTVMGSIESCGCFGELIHFTPLASFIKSVVLWIMSFGLVVFCLKRQEPWNVDKLIKDPYTYLCIVVSIILPIYSLLFFNEMSHAMYVIVYVLLCCVISGIIVMYIKGWSWKSSRVQMFRGSRV